MASKRILIVSSGGLTHGGVEVFLYTWMAHASRESYDFIWYFPCEIVDQSFADAYRQLGVHLISGGIPISANAASKSQKMWIDLNDFLKTTSIDILHVNTGSVSTNAVALRIAKKNNIPVRIAHSHSSGALKKSKIERVTFPVLWAVINACATKKVACSALAAEALFGKKHAKEAIIVKNTIDAKKFAFSEENRDMVRKQFNLQDCFVVGQVARLAPEKNQKFLLDIFREILKKDDTARLLLVGNGPMENELRDYAGKLGIEQYVVFAGATDAPEKFYPAMDVFVLTSLFEGFPITGVEAQAAGLPCFFSDTITQDASITENTFFLLLDYSPDIWAEKIIEFKSKAILREKGLPTVERSGYDVKSIQQYYDLLYS